MAASGFCMFFYGFFLEWLLDQITTHVDIFVVSIDGLQIGLSFSFSFNFIYRSIFCIVLYCYGICYARDVIVPSFISFSQLFGLIVISAFMLLIVIDLCLRLICYLRFICYSWRCHYCDGPMR